MDAPERQMDTSDTQVPVSWLLQLPPEILDQISQHVPNLSALLQANRQLSEDASLQWANYLKYVANELNVSNLPDIDDDQIFIGLDTDIAIIDTVCAWIVLADEFTAQWDNVDLGSLGDYTGYVQQLAASIQMTIRSGLDKVAVKFMMAAEDSWTKTFGFNCPSIDQAIMDAYTRIMKRYWD